MVATSGRLRPMFSVIAAAFNNRRWCPAMECVSAKASDARLVDAMRIRGDTVLDNTADAARQAGCDRRENAGPFPSHTRGNVIEGANE